MELLKIYPLVKHGWEVRKYPRNRREMFRCLDCQRIPYIIIHHFFLKPWHHRCMWPATLQMIAFGGDGSWSLWGHGGAQFFGDLLWPGWPYAWVPCCDGWPYHIYHIVGFTYNYIYIHNKYIYIDLYIYIYIYITGRQTGRQTSMHTYRHRHPSIHIHTHTYTYILYIILCSSYLHFCRLNQPWIPTRIPWYIKDVTSITATRTSSSTTVFSYTCPEERFIFQPGKASPQSTCLAV